jgi:hypothetical protein
MWSTKSNTKKNHSNPKAPIYANLTLKQKQINDNREISLNSLDAVRHSNTLKIQVRLPNEKLLPLSIFFCVTKLLDCTLRQDNRMASIYKAAKFKTCEIQVINHTRSTLIKLEASSLPSFTMSMFLLPNLFPVILTLSYASFGGVFKIQRNTIWFPWLGIKLLKLRGQYGI